MERSSYQSISDELPNNDTNGRRDSSFDSDSEDDQDRTWKEFSYGKYRVSLIGKTKSENVREMTPIFNFISLRILICTYFQCFLSSLTCFDVRPLNTPNGL